MTQLNDEKLKMMEDEMNRFEEEIGLPNLPLPPSPPKPTTQPVIGANTFNQVQAQLNKIENAPPGPGAIPPPPPPPPPMFVPPQVQRMGGPMNMPMDGSGPPMPSMPFGPPGGFPMGFGPPVGPMPPMGPGGPRPMQQMGGPMGPGPMGPGPMGPGPMGPGPMGPGPMGPGPMGPGPMGHMGPMRPGPMGPGGHGMGPGGPGMGPRGPGMGPGGPGMGPGGPGMGPGGPGMGPGGPGMGQGGPGMGPGGPGMGPGGHNMGPGGPGMGAGPMPPMGPPGPGSMLGPGPGFIPPPPEFVQAKVQSSQGPVVLSGAPKKYNAGGPEEPPKPVTMGPEYPAELAEQQNEEKKNKKQKSSAKEMAEKVKATTIISTVHEVGTQPNQTNQTQKKKDKKNKKFIRTAGGHTWEDTSLSEWEEDDFRLFCGDLGNDVTDEVLTRAFSKYSSFMKAKVVRDKRTNKTKGFGFVSFKDPQDFIRATKEMNGRYVGSRPIKLRKSMWRNRNLDVVRKKDKEKAALIGLLTGRT